MPSVILTKEVYMVANAPMITIQVLTESPRALIPQKKKRQSFIYKYHMEIKIKYM